MATVSPLLGEGPYSNTDFASMLISLYQMNYSIRIPNFELVLNNPLPSIGVNDGTDGEVEGQTFGPIPTSSAEYVGEVEAIIANLPEGYLCDIYTAETTTSNDVTNTVNAVNTFTYQNTTLGWVLQAPVQAVIGQLNNQAEDNLE